MPSSSSPADSRLEAPAAPTSDAIIEIRGLRVMLGSDSQALGPSARAARACRAGLRVARRIVQGNAPSGPVESQPPAAGNLDEADSERRESFLLDIPLLDIRRGSFTSILGASGCGKTTLLQVLSLLKPPTSCETLIFHPSQPHQDGKQQSYSIYEDFRQASSQLPAEGWCRPEEEREKFREKTIGFCIQGGALLPALSVVDNVMLASQLVGHEAPAEKALECLDAFSSEVSSVRTKAGELPRYLSGGQKQRVVVARAIAHSPEIIILDEPTSSLDPHTARITIDYLKSLAGERGITVIMVTHDTSLAVEFSDEIVCMAAFKPEQPDKEQYVIRGAIIDEPTDGRIADWRAQRAKRRVDEVSVSPTFQSQPPDPPLRRRISMVARLAFLDALGPIYTRYVERPLGLRPTAIEKIKLRGSTTFLFSLFSSALVAVMVALQVLLLMGMRSGLVEKFKQDLLKSPTARELTIMPGGGLRGMTDASLQELRADNPAIEMIIPATRYPVFTTEKEEVLSTAEGLEGTRSGETIDLYGTYSFDPKLTVTHREYGGVVQDFSGLDRDAIVLPDGIAEELGASVGSDVSLWIGRYLNEDSSLMGFVPLKLRVCNLIAGQGRIAWVHLDTTDDIADYKAGRPVPSRDWEGFPRPMEPRYSSYLVMAKDELGGRERVALNSLGLQLNELPAEDPRTEIFGFFRDSATVLGNGKRPILFYELVSGWQADGHNWLYEGTLNSAQEALMDSDCIVIPWNEPLPARLEGSPAPIQLIGLTGSARWTRSHMWHPKTFFPKGSNAWELAPAFRTPVTSIRELEVEQGDASVRFDMAVHLPEIRDAAQAMEVAADLRQRIEHRLALADEILGLRPPSAQMPDEGDAGSPESGGALIPAVRPGDEKQADPSQQAGSLARPGADLDSQAQQGESNQIASEHQRDAVSDPPDADQQGEASAEDDPQRQDARHLDKDPLANSLAKEGDQENLADAGAHKDDGGTPPLTAGDGTQDSDGGDQLDEGAPGTRIEADPASQEASVASSDVDEARDAPGSAREEPQTVPPQARPIGEEELAVLRAATRATWQIRSTARLWATSTPSGEPLEGADGRTLKEVMQDIAADLGDLHEKYAGLLASHDPSEQEFGPPVVVVPASFLSGLHMLGAGKAVAFRGESMFRAAPEERKYDQARVFVHDVFQVADMHKTLMESFAVRSNQDRVTEAQHNIAILDKLVSVAQLVALLVAIIAVYFVFRDLCERKKAMIGTVRIMGLGRHGVLLVLLIRGSLMALCGGITLTILGSVLGRLLNTWEAGMCRLVPGDYLLTTLGLFVVCLLGTLVPAWQAAHIDPVEALKQAEDKF